MPQPPSSSQLKSSDFVHLHNHTHYSLLDGLQKIPEMLDRVKELGMEAVALTDHGSLSGAIEFYKQAQERGIKPIIGIESYVARRKHTDKQGKPDANPHHIILLAMNNQGYENLMRLSTIAHLDGFYYKPRVDKALLKKYNAGLIALSACIGSEVGEALEQNNPAQAEKAASWYKKVFGDRYYLELQDHGHEWDVQKRVNQELFKLADKLDIPLVVTADAHYALPEDQDAHEVLLCVQTGSLLEDEKRMSLKDMNLHLSDPKEIIGRWGDTPEVITNTRAIADRCEIEIKLGEMLIPRFDVPTAESEEEYLLKSTYQGLAWRYGGKSRTKSLELTLAAAKKLLNKAVIERAEYELGLIQKMGFSGYFLIIADFMDWGKERGILFGPGRGSAAGSIVSYALGITDLDPLEYNLLFERLLNPDRISMPDIDIDIMDTRRDEVVEYVEEKYGKERVAHIVTFGTMAARNAIRDTARVLGVAYADADRLAKMVPPPIQGRHIPLGKSVKENAELKREYQENKQSQQVIDLAIRLEGTIRSHGVHAAGVVIAPDELVKYAPLEMAQKGVVSTQYSMGPVEELGLLKMDFLGLSNLTTIKNALRIIRKVHAKELDILKLPLDDQKTFELLGRGDTTGVFQLESGGMKQYLKQLKPNHFEDIIAMVSLYRPGPMAELPRYIEGKNDPDKITYPHASLEPILKDTYGVMVYQEQIIAMLQLIAGYTAGEADLVRKAIGKKKREIMKAEEPKFIQGCLEQGLTKTQAENLWALIQPFADYSFNKSHAACYAMIAYQTAYLKAHYPAAFMAALMTSDFGDTDRIAIEINECRYMGIEVLPPDINESFVEFAIRPSDGAIRFGMAAIKNVGVGAVEKILEAREDGEFKSIEEFARRVSTRDVNRKTWESLIKAGAFDSFGGRYQLITNLDKILAYAQKVQKDADSGQIDMFGSEGDQGQLIKLELNTSDTSTPAKEQERELLQWEKELLGVYLSRHPLEAYAKYLEKYTQPFKAIKTSMEGKRVRIGGVVTAVRKITTRTGAPMAFVAMEDLDTSLELVVFPKTYEEYAQLWEEDRVLEVEGKVSSKDRDGKLSSEIKILADKVRELTDEAMGNPPSTPPAPRSAVPTQRRHANQERNSAQKQSPTSPTKKRLLISLPNGNDTDQLVKLKEMLARHSGDDEVLVRLGGDHQTTIKLPFTVKAEATLVKDVGLLVGEKAVSVS